MACSATSASLFSLNPKSLFSSKLSIPNSLNFNTLPKPFSLPSLSFTPTPTSLRRSFIVKASIMSLGTSSYWCYLCDQYVRVKRRHDTEEACSNCDSEFVEKMEQPPRRYEVFLSFRGEDTRASFTAHLHASLRNAGIIVFRDDDSLQKGTRISDSLLRAIEDSQISVIVFSKNYANSWWCLDELENIMKCHRTIWQVVLPVFYGVAPSEVRHQTGEFGNAFQNLLNTISEKKPRWLSMEEQEEEEEEEEETPLREHLEQRWRAALREAAGLAGFVVLNSG